MLVRPPCVKANKAAEKWTAPSKPVEPVESVLVTEAKLKWNVGAGGWGGGLGWGWVRWGGGSGQVGVGRGGVLVKPGAGSEPVAAGHGGGLECSS